VAFFTGSFLVVLKVATFFETGLIDAVLLIKLELGALEEEAIKVAFLVVVFRSLSFLVELDLKVAPLLVGIVL
jgi:hypothetical protein